MSKSTASPEEPAERDGDTAQSTAPPTAAAATEGPVERNGDNAEPDRLASVAEPPSNDQASMKSDRGGLSRIFSVPVLTVLCTAIVGPIAVHVVTNAQERRKLQSELMEKVLASTDKTNFDDPSHVLRLGFIAHMVGENEAVFGIRLSGAEERARQLHEDLRASKLGALEDELKGSKELTQSLKTQSAEYGKQLDISKARIKHLQEEKNKLDAKQTEQRAIIQQQIDNEKRDQVFFEGRIQAAETKIAQLTDESKRLQTSLDKTRADLQNQIVVAGKTAQDVVRYKSLAENNAADVKSLKASLDQASKTIQTLQDQLTAAKELNKSLQQKLENQDNCIHATTQAAVSPLSVQQPGASASGTTTHKD